MNEQDYTTGWRVAWLDMLQECLARLGHDYGALGLDSSAAWLIEREQIVQALRRICADFGDSDWDENLSLVDVIEKHLARRLREAKP